LHWHQLVFRQESNHVRQHLCTPLLPVQQRQTRSHNSCCHLYLTGPVRALQAFLSTCRQCDDPLQPESSTPLIRIPESDPMHVTYYTNQLFIPARSRPARRKSTATPCRAHGCCFAWHEGPPHMPLQMRAASVHGTYHEGQPKLASQGPAILPDRDGSGEATLRAPLSKAKWIERSNPTGHHPRCTPPTGPFQPGAPAASKTPRRTQHKSRRCNTYRMRREGQKP
jgi:hypothetical protein